MSTLMQTSIVAAVIAGALVYLLRSAWRQLRKPQCGGGAGCRCGE